MKKNIAFKSAVGAATILSFVATADVAMAKEREKCYGVAKAGKNDCGSATGSHSCAGQATIDRDPNEWIYLPKGACNKIVGGSLLSAVDIAEGKTAPASEEKEEKKGGWFW